MRLDPPKNRDEASASSVGGGNSEPARGGSGAGGDKWDNVFRAGQGSGGGAKYSSSGGRTLTGNDARTRDNTYDDTPDSRYNSRPSTNQQQQQQQDDYPTLLKSALATSAATGTKALSETDIKKAAKAAARIEADRKLKEEKAAKEAAIKAAKEAEKLELESNLFIADSIINSGKQGDDLVKHIQSLETSTSASALITKILLKVTEATDLSWCKKTAYGSALKHLMENNVKSQVQALYTLQKYCHDLKFPKIDVKGQKKYFIDTLFQQLYINEIVEDDGYTSWANDDGLYDDVPGRVNALVQTTAFLALITTEDDVEYDEEEEEIDAPRETMQ